LAATVQIDRVAHGNPFRVLNRAADCIRPMLRLVREASSNGSVLGHTAARNSHQSVINLVELLLDRVLKFPDPQCFWLRPALRQLDVICSKNRPDVVLATGKPWTSLVVGKLIGKRLGVPFVADFRDPWVRNPSGAASKAVKNLEADICRSAARVITTTSELRDQLAEDYPKLSGRFVTITNGFDSAEYSSGTSEYVIKSGGTRRNKSVLELTHFGTIYGMRNPIELLRAMQELFHEKTIAPGHVRIRFVGTWEVSSNPTDERLVEELEASGLVTREPPIQHFDCLRRMSTSDVLLLLQPGYPLQIPAKIYEYIAVARPILVIGGEGATASLVKTHRIGTCVPNNVAEIKKALLRLATRQCVTDIPTPEERARFDYRNLTRELADVLEAVSIHH
jgi:glycosyltransferase involved in cell wall biosynthesis